MTDLSQPLHNTEWSSFNKRYHKAVDGVVNDDVLENLDKIKIYPIKISSEEDLTKEIARMANLSMVLGYKFSNTGALQVARHCPDWEKQLWLAFCHAGATGFRAEFRGWRIGPRSFGAGPETDQDSHV